MSRSMLMSYGIYKDNFTPMDIQLIMFAVTTPSPPRSSLVSSWEHEVNK